MYCYYNSVGILNTQRFSQSDSSRHWKNSCTHLWLMGNIVERTTVETKQVLTTNVESTAIANAVDDGCRCLYTVNSPPPKVPAKHINQLSSKCWPAPFQNIRLVRNIRLLIAWKFPHKNLTWHLRLFVAGAAGYITAINIVHPLKCTSAGHKYSVCQTTLNLWVFLNNVAALSVLLFPSFKYGPLIHSWEVETPFVSTVWWL
jgi:hypothetical protein